jgi:class 3 adenylate cyclase
MTQDRLTGPARSGERKLVTLLFADLSGYTALVASMDPEEAYAFVRPGMAGLQRIVEDHGGTVPQVMGDGFMAVFGVPAAHEDDAERAVRAGLAVRDHARELRRRGTGTPFPEIHAGITSGEVMVAPSGEAAGFAVDGDAVNTASRLADQARPGQVLVDDGTRRRTLHAIRYGPGDSTRSRGRRARWRPSKPRGSARQPPPVGPPQRSREASSTGSASWRRSGGRWGTRSASAAPACSC